MLNLDEFVDALEEEVAAKGVLAVDLQKLAPAPNTFGSLGRERSGILIEMLRVWMEHRWRSGYPVSVLDCLDEFPNESFSEEELESLRFEDQRLRRTVDETSETNSRDVSIESLPNLGEMWGEFELLGILGIGAFAKVYLARQHGLAGRLVALKLIFRQTHESHWLATLQHSAIVPIYSTHCLGQIYGICMPFLGNSTLADLLQETPKSTTISKGNWWSKSKRKSFDGGGALLSTIHQRHGQIDTIVKTVEAKLSDDTQLPSSVGISNPGVHSPASQNLSHCGYVDAICWIGSQLADALSYAHCNGIVHSDIKPANVLVAFDGQPRLLDFNVSYKSTRDGIVTTDFPIGGTIPYMSPEHRQALSKPAVVDARSDVFSLGVVLFEMLTGRLPQPAAGAANPSQWNASVSPAMSAILSKCLEHDPKARYQSAEALRDDLTAQLHHEPLVHQPEPSQIERFLKWCYRHPRLSSSISIASLATMLIAFLIAGVVVRQNALTRADWVHRIDLLRERLPNSMAMLTSLDAVPELEPDVSADIQQTFALVESSKLLPKHVDRRWETGDSVSDAIRSELSLLAWLAGQRSWKTPLAIPIGLNDSKDSGNDSNQGEETRNIFKKIQAREYLAAIDLLNNRIEQNPRDYVGWWLLGDCYNASQDFSNAQKAYTVCIALQPKTAIAYLNRGMARYSASAFELAAQDYAKTSTLVPSWHWSRLNRALSLQKLGRIDDAISELDKAIEAGYETVSVYRLRAELLAASGDADAAKLDYANALQCEPKTDQQWMDRGLIRLSLNPAQAAEDFASALIANPTSIDANQKLAFVYSELLQNPENGLKHSNRLVELAPWQPTHLAGRAVQYARAGQTQEAVHDLQLLEKMLLQEPIVMYQVTCGYSILAGNAALQGKETLDYFKSAFRWFTKAVRADASILSIAISDPDIQWLREQSEFQEIAKAVTSLNLPSP